MAQVRLQFIGVRVIQGMQAVLELAHRVLHVVQANIRVHRLPLILHPDTDTPCAQHVVHAPQIKLA